MRHNTDIDYTLYLVTDRSLLGGRDLLLSIEEAILGGVTVVQLREKDLSTLEFFHLATRVKSVTDRFQVPLIINDRLDIALAINAAGLHIGQDDLPGVVARRLMGPGKILGISATTLEEAITAKDEGADYLGIGAIFPTGTKLDARDVSLDTLSAIKNRVKIPVVAIGGINLNNIKFVKEQNIDGVAVVSAILGRENIRLAAQELYEIFK
jgi:thiamine-phosphate pyrophosphorylase